MKVLKRLLTAKQKRSGFSLLEVMVSLAILASLGVALIQSSIQNLWVVNRLKQDDPIIAAANQQILLFEIEPKVLESFPNIGNFPETSPLAGKKWRIEQKTQELHKLPLILVTYSIDSSEGSNQKTISSSFYTSSKDFLTGNLGDLLKSFNLN